MTTPPESDSVEAARHLGDLKRAEDEAGSVVLAHLRHLRPDAEPLVTYQRAVIKRVTFEVETAVVERERTLPMFRCDCGAPATWRGEWSDREMYVCDDHRDLVRLAHDGDHEYDRSGITWRGANGGYEYEPAAALAQTTDGTP